MNFSDFAIVNSSFLPYTCLIYLLSLFLVYRFITNISSEVLVSLAGKFFFF